MTEPAKIAREAKALHQTVKEAIKYKEPYDKDVDFLRKDLRRHYLNLLLVHPDAKESQDVENHLWMQTSYAFISSYKQRVTALDRAIQNQQRQQQTTSAQGQQQQPRTNPHQGIVEHRKLVQRFRHFLSEEEKFWTQLVMRLRRMFDLTEAQPALVALGLMDIVGPAVNTETEGRNHFQFPPEDPTMLFVSATPEERQGRLAILSKALICLGDIARYRELYTENTKRDDAKRGRNRRGGGVDNPPRPKNYTKAQQCYEQARLLVPTEGNPSHQLAILASYKKDSFASLIHYYRALCVSQPYDTAAENLGTVLSKALEVWRSRKKRDRVREDAQTSVRVRTDLLQENIVILHALWRVGMDKGIEKMKSISPKHDDKVSNGFFALVSERHLSIDTISNIVVLSQGALWKHRMIRHVPAPNHRGHPPIPVPPGTPKLIEWSIVSHLLDLHIDLLEVGKDELKDPPQMDGLEDLAQRISATFRRTLPALRIASKWLRANFSYIAQDLEYAAFLEQEKQRDEETQIGEGMQKKSSHKISAFSPKTRLFWETYAQFILALSQAFPKRDLPAFDAPLEEDTDMRGFLPLKSLMGEDKKIDGGKSIGGNMAREQVHPNVEQLMRISDLLDDANYLAKLENSPLALFNNHVVFNPEMAETSQRSSPPEVTPLVEELAAPVHRPSPIVTRDASLDLTREDDHDMDESMEANSLTDDDPVDAVFNTVIDRTEALEEDDDDDEEIVWNPRASISSPVVSPSIHATPFTPKKPLLSPQALSPHSPRSPTHYHANRSNSFNVPSTSPPPAPATTAQDLLFDVMGLGPSTNRAPLSAKTISAPQPLLLFGSSDIWSASSDEKPLMYNGAGGSISGSHSTSHAYQTSPRQFQAAPGHSQGLSQQSPWMSSYPNQSQNSQQNYVGALPSTSFVRPPQMMMSPPENIPRHQTQQHQRISSLSSPSMHSFSHNSPIQQQNPFAYSTPSQLPIQRPQQNYGPSRYTNQPIHTVSGHSGVPAQYLPGPPATFHSKQLSMHDPRLSQQNYLSPPMSQVWSNTG